MPYHNYFGSDVDTISYISKLLSDPSSGLDLPAAMILETVQGEGGVNVASTQWLQGIQSLCRQHKILLIVDDIQVGCGRTGSFFSFEEAGIKPDIITLSKSLGGIGLPMALVLMKPELDQWKPGEHNGTFRGNNLAFTAASEAIKTFWADDSFSQDIAKKSAILRQHLQWIKADHPELKARVRGRGLIYGIEIGAPDIAHRIVAECFKRKLIIETCGPTGNVIKFLGPLNMSKELLTEGLERLAESVKAVLSKTHAASTSTSC
jgi:diaminobutyrate-2-oxoglutarate transaminase